MSTPDTKLYLTEIVTNSGGARVSASDVPVLDAGATVPTETLTVAGGNGVVVIGNPGDNDKDVDAGRVFVIVDTVAGGDTTYSAATTVITMDGVAAGDEAGASVGVISDLNGDGVAEILVGAPGADTGAGADAGRTYVVWGTTTAGGVDLGDATGGNGAGFSITGQAAGDQSGGAVTAIADANADGKSEILVGAIGNDQGGADAGAAYVVFGKSSKADVSLTNIAAGTGGYKIVGENAGDHAGGALAALGDQNGDGKGDLLIGATGNDAGGTDAGAVYVVFNKATTAQVNLDDVAAGIGGYKIIGQVGEGVGASVSGIGDVNGDGIADILIGTAAGDKAYVVFGKASTTTIDLANVEAGTGGFAIYGEAAGDLVGISVAGGTDLNGDGISDFVIGAQHNAEGGFDAGAVYAVWGGASGAVHLSDVAASIGGSKIVGAYGSLTGSEVAIVGDANGDGVSDIAIGSAATFSVTTVYTPTDLWVPEITVRGTSGDDIIDYGYGSAHKIGDDADVVEAGGGNDIVATHGGNDQIDGGTGADTMLGGSGDDTYLVDNAGDIVTELRGEGSDTVIASIDYSLTAGSEVDTLVLDGFGLSGTGNELANHIIGTAGADTLNGGGGADVLEGGDGDDLYIVCDAAAIVETAAGGHDTVLASVDYTLADNVEDLTLGVAGLTGTGNGGDNVLTGTSGSDTLIGLDGNDALIGGAGADVMIGGMGDDTYYVDDPADQVIETADGGFDTVVVSGDWVLADNIEAVRLVGTGHSLTGNDAGNRLEGDAGDDILDGGAGDDSELGGDGNDRLISSSGHDTLVGGAGDDVYVIKGGSAHIEDFEGHDTIDASEATGDSHIDLSGETLSEVEHQSVDFGTGGTVSAKLDVQFLQDLTGSFFDDIDTVRALIPQIVSALQAVQSNTEFGVSTFRDKPIGQFGAPDDWVYLTQQALSTDTAALTAAYNAMVANNGNDGPEAQIEALMQLALRATSEVGFSANAARFVVLFTDADFHVAGDGALEGILTANNGDAILDGNGIGEDYPMVAQVKAALEAANIIPIFAVAGGYESTYQGLASALGRGTVVTLSSDSSNVVSAITTGLTLATTTSIDDAMGGAGNDTLFGNSLDNLLVGNAGNDLLKGGAGNDTLKGGDGDDQLWGDGGSNSLDGGAGTDQALYAGLSTDYTVESQADGSTKVTSLVTGSVDTLTGIEQVAFADITVAPGGSTPPANQAPVVSADVTLTANEDASPVSVSALLNATDPDGNALSVVVDPASLPAGVTYDATTGSFVLDPSDAAFQSLGVGESATLSIGYGVSDGTATTAATLVVTVNGVNDAAVLGTADVTLVETDTALSTGGTLSISDIDSPATFIAQTDTAGTYGSFTIGTDGTWSFVANSALDALLPGETVTDTFSVSAADGTLTQVSVTIEGTAEALIISGTTTGDALEDELTVVAGTASAADRFGTAGSFIAADGLAGSYGTLSIDAAGHWTYSLDNANSAVQALGRGETLADTVTVSAVDGTTADIVITIGGIGEHAGAAPIYGTAGDDIINGTASDDIIYALDGNDQIHAGDGNDIIYGGWGRDFVDAGAGDDFISVVGGTNGPVRLSADPVDGGAGYDTVLLEGNQTDYHIVKIVGASPQINATDLRTGQTAVFVNVEALTFLDGSVIEIVPRNVAPTVSGPVVLAATEDSGVTTVNALSTAADTNGDALSAIVDASLLPAGVSYDATTQSFSIDSANSAFQSLGAGEQANYSIGYQITDGALTVAATLEITVTGTNDAPNVIAQAATATTEGGSIVSVSALAGATDSDAHDVLAVVNLPGTLPAGVSFDAATQRFIFNPADPAYAALNSGEMATISVSYGVSDGLATTPAQVVFTLAGVTQSTGITVTGTSRADTLIGTSGNDTIDGKGGADIMTGLGGDDTYIVDNARDVVVEVANGGIDTVLSSVNYTLGAEVENLTLTGSAKSGTGNSLDNLLLGNSGANTLYGLDGNDRFDGGAGSDTMYGGNGDDTYIVTDSGDVVDERGSTGIDKVLSSVSFSLSDGKHGLGDIENLELTGTAAINAEGNALANHITGNSGNNVLAGLGGADVIDGGDGIDTASYAKSAAGVAVSLAAGTASGGDAEGDHLVSIENLTGSSGNDVLEGDGGNNVLTGGANEGAGDTVSYAHAGAGVVIDLGLTTAQNTGGAGIDTLKGFENAIGSAFDDTLTAAAKVAATLMGLDGNDRLVGGSASDTLIGGLGADILTGGKGEDHFVFDVPDGAMDTITDFRSGTDKLVFDADIFAGLRPGQTPLLTFAADVTGGAIASATGHFIFDTSGAGGGTLYWDANGGAADDAVAVAKLNTLSITASDLSVI